MSLVYAGKLAYIDLTTLEYRYEPITDDMVTQYLLGSGLAARIYYDRMDPSLDALDPDSPLIMLNGLFTGTFMPTGCRSSWCGRSPLTGIWNESNMGGHFGAELRRAGLDGFVVTGSAPEPTYIWIDGERGGIEFRPAGHLWGLDHYETVDKLREETDPKAQIACIGPAGENLVRFASVMQGGQAHARTAGRGGMGAVLGSKRLKAIAVKGGGGKPTYADAKGLRDIVRDQNSLIRERAQGLGQLGTAGGVVGAEAIGGLPINNWRDGEWQDAPNISGQRIHETLWNRHTFCHACPIGCGKQIEIKEGKYASTSGASPEYETVALLGANLRVADLHAIAKANDLCNRYGMDTISAGGVIALAFEAHERGLLTRQECNDLDPTWSNGDAVVALVEAIAFRQGIGDLLSEGLSRAAKRLAAEDLDLTVKGLEVPGHDPRAFVAMGVNYATANRGACHLEGFAHWNAYGVRHPDLGYSESLDPHDSTLGAKLAVDYQNYIQTFNPLGLCKFIGAYGAGPDRLVQLVNTALGWHWTREELLGMGEKLFNLKRMINCRFGVSRKDDVLPQRLLTLPRPSGNAAGVLPDLDLMLDDYYRLRNWDENGVPRSSTLSALGLADIAPAVTSPEG